MIEPLIYILIAGGLFVSLLNWRVGVSLCLLVGFCQDPIRKMVTGEPVYFSVLIVAFLAVCFVGANVKGGILSFRPLYENDIRTRRPVKLFLIWVMIECFLAYARTSSIVISGIGFLAYFAPVAALLLMYYYARDERIVFSFFQKYVFLTLIFLLGVYLSWFGIEWKILRSIGAGLHIYAEGVGAINLPSGFFRAPEVAAWHGGAAVCLLIVLATTNSNQAKKILAGAAVLFLVGAIVLTGRRKALMMIMMFVPFYGFLLAWFRGKTGGRRLASTLLIMSLGLVLFFGQIGFFLDSDVERLRPYTQRGLSVGGDAVERLKLMTVDSLKWVIARNGWLGSGAGTGSQGAQHFGGGSAVVGGAAEGGIGKVLAELGVPGLFLLCWFVFAMFRQLLRILKRIARQDTALMSLACGLVAFMVVNAAVFVTAHQIYGDVFVLLILGSSLGFVLAIPRILAAREQSHKGVRS